MELPKPLPPYASVTIIGGGVMGVSTAFHLARAGVGGVLVVEQNLLGSGSSAKPLGGVRATFSDPATSCWRNAVSQPLSDLEPSSESTLVFGRLDTCSYAGPRPL